MMKKMILTVCALVSAVALYGAELTVNCVKGSESVARTFLPAVQLAQGERAVLQFTGFMKRNVASGWCPVVSLKINGKTVNEKDSAGKLRLLDKGSSFSMFVKGRKSEVKWWYMNSRLLVFYGTGTGCPDARTGLDEKAWTYRLDITDLIAPNSRVQVAVINYLYRETAGFDTGFVMKDLKIIKVKANKGH